MIVKRLIAAIITGVELDSYKMTLAAVIENAHPDVANGLTSEIEPSLLKGLSQRENEYVLIACLDLSGVMFRKFGDTIRREPHLIDNERFRECLFTLLTSNNASLSKRSSTALGFFSTILSKEELNNLICKLFVCINGCRDKTE